MNERISYLCGKCRYRNNDPRCVECNKGSLFMEDRVIAAATSRYPDVFTEFATNTFATKTQAEKVLSMAIDHVNTYGCIAVRDLAELCGYPFTNYEMAGHGWTCLNNAKVESAPGGYRNILPGRPKSLYYEEKLMLNYKKDYVSYAEKIRKSLTNPLTIKNVIFNEPATIVFWADGTKTVVKCQDGDVFDPEKGLAMAFMKKVLGNKGHYFETVKKWVPEEIKEDVPEWVKTQRENLENGVVFPCAGCGKWNATNCLSRPCEKLESYNKALDALKEEI